VHSLDAPLPGRLRCLEACKVVVLVGSHESRLTVADIVRETAPCGLLRLQAPGTS
jgi:hypothetical protein